MSNSNEIETKFSKILLEARTNTEQKRSHQSLFSGLFHTVKTIPVLELDGTPIHDIFSVLCLSPEYSEDQFDNIKLFSYLHTYLLKRLESSGEGSIDVHPAFLDAVICYCDRVLHQFTNYANLDAQLEIELATAPSRSKNTIRSIFTDSIVDVRVDSPSIHQSDVELPTSTNVMSVSPHSTIPACQWTSEASESCATEAVRILSILCVAVPSISRKIVPVLWRLRAPLWNLSLAAVLMCMTLSTTMEWGKTVLIEAEDAVDSFIEEALAASFRRQLLTLQTWNLILMHSKPLLARSTTISTRAPLLLKTLGWHSRLCSGNGRSSIAASFLPLFLASPETSALMETFHLLLDIPTVVALSEIASGPNQTSQRNFFAWANLVKASAGKDVIGSVHSEISLWVSFFLRNECTHLASSSMGEDTADLRAESDAWTTQHPTSSSLHPTTSVRLSDQNTLAQQLRLISLWASRPYGNRLQAFSIIMTQLCRRRVQKLEWWMDTRFCWSTMNREWSENRKNNIEQKQSFPSTVESSTSDSFFGSAELNRGLGLLTSLTSLPTRVSSACNVASLLLSEALAVVSASPKTDALEVFMEVVLIRSDLVLPADKYINDIEQVVVESVRVASKQRNSFLNRPRIVRNLCLWMLRTNLFNADAIFNPNQQEEMVSGSSIGGVRENCVEVMEIIVTSYYSWQMNMRKSPCKKIEHSENQSLTDGSTCNLYCYLEVFLCMIDRITVDLLLFLQSRGGRALIAKCDNTLAQYISDLWSNMKQRAAFHEPQGNLVALEVDDARWNQLSSVDDVHVGGAKGLHCIEKLLRLIPMINGLTTSTFKMELLSLLATLKQVLLASQISTPRPAGCLDSRDSILESIERSSACLMGEEVVDLRCLVGAAKKRFHTSSGWGILGGDTVQLEVDPATLIAESAEWTRWMVK